MKGSVVMAKIAGTESTAKIRSTISTSTSARNSGVAHSDQLAGRWVRLAHEERVAVQLVGDAHVPAAANFSSGLLLDVGHVVDDATAS